MKECGICAVEESTESSMRKKIKKTKKKKEKRKIGFLKTVKFHFNGFLDKKFCNFQAHLNFPFQSLKQPTPSAVVHLIRASSNIHNGESRG